MADTTTVVCRLHRGYTVFAVTALGGGAALCFLTTGGSTATVDWVLPATLLLGVSVLTAWLLSGYVIAEGAGLRWRIGFASGQAAWGEVCDYHDLLAGPTQRSGRMVIRTSAGDLHVSPEEWTNHTALRAFVHQRATSAKARSWGVLGTRPEDEWPRTFTYDGRRLRRESIMTQAMALALVAVILWMVLPGIGRIAAEVGWGLALMASALTLIPVLSLSLLPFARRDTQDSLRRLDHRITVDQEGITFEGDHRRVVSPWKDVLATRVGQYDGFIRMGGRYSVETRHGSFDYGRIQDARLLREIIAGYARWSTASRETPNERLLPLTAEETLGVARLHTYWTRTNRALLWYPLATGLIICCAIALQVAGWINSHRDPVAGIILGTSAVLFGAWTRRRCRTVCVRTDNIGVTWIGPNRRVAIPWTAVESLRTLGTDSFIRSVVSGAGKRITFWHLIHDPETLIAEIRARAPQVDGETGDSKPGSD